ncbi:hypothetical protein KPH14_009732 [Odynerus spinipes]|uniref:Uncharacterized protein n=1 Tax=Odynerus spinipes TaxID=1348599 RepID=A0AAD9RQ57_9HYME|nr:hypothetical protein KPH14_009732 [Odynerus spinipes]
MAGWSMCSSLSSVGSLQLMVPRMVASMVAAIEGAWKIVDAAAATGREEGRGVEALVEKEAKELEAVHEASRLNPALLSHHANSTIDIGLLNEEYRFESSSLGSSSCDKKLLLLGKSDVIARLKFY